MIDDSMTKSPHQYTEETEGGITATSFSILCRTYYSYIILYIRLMLLYILYKWMLIIDQYKIFGHNARNEIMPIYIHQISIPRYWRRYHLLCREIGVCHIQRHWPRFTSSWTKIAIGYHLHFRSHGSDPSPVCCSPLLVGSSYLMLIIANR